MDAVVIGSGGLAREFTTFFSSEVNIVGFSSHKTDDFDSSSLGGEFFGSNITPDNVGTKYAVLAIASPAAKRDLSSKLKAIGFEFPNFIHSSVINAGGAKLKNSEGVIISPNSVLAPNVEFADHVYINFMVGVGHDVKFGSFIQVNPGAQIGGAVSVGNGVVIGSGATILQGLKIRDASTVGSGSVVFSSVREDTTVMGNPAKRLKIPSCGD